MFFTKLKRPQTFIGFGEIIVGIGLFLIEVFAGGIPLSWPFSWEIWLSIGLTTMGISLIVWGLFKSETPIESFKYRYKKAHQIVSLLRKADERLWHIADDYVIRNLNQEKLQECTKKVNKLLNVKVSGLDPNMSKAEMLEAGKQSFIDTKKQMEPLEQNTDLEKEHQLFQKITGIIDDEGWGLREDKKSDRKYKNYRRKIDRYFDTETDIIDSWVQYLTRYHIHKSEFFCNAFLMVKYAKWVIQKSHIPDLGYFLDVETQARLANIENNRYERLEEVRVAIGDYIKELENQEWETKYK